MKKQDKLINYSEETLENVIENLISKTKGKEIWLKSNIENVGAKLGENLKFKDLAEIESKYVPIYEGKYVRNEELNYSLDFSDSLTKLICSLSDISKNYKLS
jgi:hypothetical protein